MRMLPWLAAYVALIYVGYVSSILLHETVHQVHQHISGFKSGGICIDWSLRLLERCGGPAGVSYIAAGPTPSPEWYVITEFDAAIVSLTYLAILLCLILTDALRRVIRE